MFEWGIVVGYLGDVIGNVYFWFIFGKYSLEYYIFFFCFF